MDEHARHGADARVVAAAAFINAALIILAVVQRHEQRLHSGTLGALLFAAALLAGLTVVRNNTTISVSGSFLVILLGCALTGPAITVLLAVSAEGVAAARLQTPLKRISTNLLGVIAPALCAANLMRVLHPAAGGSIGFYLAAALAGTVYLCLNFGLIALFTPVHTGEWSLTPRVFVAYLPTQALTIALALMTAGLYYEVGLAGVAFALVAVFAFSYMAQLLEESRERARQYASLSWGVLGGLMRSLDVRDRHAARHAAAVAKFARDIAAAAGHDERDCELAHTAGLLHDIGNFALSDRVAERGRELTDEDWSAIHRHPELGADMLQDLGAYGPVAEIVLCHHERVDGLGYPRGLSGDEIPEIARIVSVAEVYDTLTASDTYRTPMSSFEALRELRRVAGTQLDERYVEVLAELLGGEGLSYRHADQADFDAELGMERRIGEAAAGPATPLRRSAR